MSSESTLDGYYNNFYQLVCPPLPYYDTFELFQLIMNILAPFSVIFGVYGIIVVLKATPKEMASAKWVILYSQVTSFNLGCVASILVRPFIYFPSTAIYATGLLIQAGVPFHYALWFGQISYPLQEISLVMLFENRCNQICNHRKVLKNSKIRFLVFTLHHLFFIAMTISHLFITPDDNLAKLDILKIIPCPEHHFFSENTHVMTTNLRRQYQINTFQSLYLFGFAFAFAFCTGYSLMSSKRNLAISKRTRDLQKRFLFALIIQVVIPFFILFIPFITFFTMMAFGSNFPFVSSLIIICVALHGTVHSILLVLLHKPYRQFTFYIFCFHNRTKPENQINASPRIVEVG